MIKKHSRNDCPSCKKKVLSNCLLLSVLFTFFYRQKCPSCNRAFIPKKNWQGNLLGALAWSLTLSGTLSVSIKAYWPYLFFFLVALVVIFVGYFFLPPEKILPQPKMQRLIDRVVILIVAMLMILLISLA